MKKIQLTTLTMMLGLAVLQTHADQTNVVQNLSIQHFALQDGDGAALTLHFSVSGFATERSTDGGQSSSLSINASGSGDRNGNLLVLQGSINVRGGTLEVVAEGSDGSGGPQS